MIKCMTAIAATTAVALTMALLVGVVVIDTKTSQTSYIQSYLQRKLTYFGTPASSSVVPPPLPNRATRGRSSYSAAAYIGNPGSEYRVAARDIYYFNNDDTDDGYDDDYHYSYNNDDDYSSHVNPNHGGHYITDQHYFSDDTYSYEYKPVKGEYITPTKGGYGGRQGRPLSDIRFNKCPPIIELEGYQMQTNAWRYKPSRDYIKGVHSMVFPLMPADYPLTNGNEKVTLLRTETMADSIVLLGDYQLHGMGSNGNTKDADYWLSHAHNTPYYPGDSGGHFWHELREVVDLQIARRAGNLPSNYNHWPDTWKDKTTLTDMALAVKGEYPGFHQATIIKQLFTEGIEMHRDMSPFRSVVDFVGTEVRMAAINVWTIDAVAALDFMLKWHVGMPRPEEVVWLISTEGGYTSDPNNGAVPEDLVTRIKSMNLQHAAEFTAYEADGCPMHPSYPAMHSAASTCSYWIPALCKITALQYCESLRVDYATAYARTVAGVHYPMDNIAGLNIGQRIVQEQLPTYMAEQFGYNAEMVRTRLKALAFDWGTFDSKACTIAGMAVGEFLTNAYNTGSGTGTGSGATSGYS